MEEAHNRALSRYVVRPYPGKVTLLRATDALENMGARRNPSLGWKNMALGGLAIHDVPGDHISMFEEPHVPILAETLRIILASDETRTGQPMALAVM